MATVDMLEVEAAAARSDIEGLRVDLVGLERTVAETSARTSANLDKLGRTVAETSANLDKLGRTVAETNARVDKLERTVAETSANLDKLERTVAETSANLDKLGRTVAQTTKQVGGIHNSIGVIVGRMIAPVLKREMNMLGYNFKASSTRIEFTDPDGRTLTEVDVLLGNGKEVMVVEVKRSLTVKHVKHHLTRMELMRKHEVITGMAGKAMYSTVAGITVDDDAGEFAKGLGMYVVYVEEDTELIRIVNPGAPAAW